MSPVSEDRSAPLAAHPSVVQAAGEVTEWNWPGSTADRVIDGDSLVVRVTRDIGFHGSVTFLTRLRLGRINTPPLNTVQGQEATLRTMALVVGLLDVTTTGPYKYGDSWMCEIVNPEGVNVSDQLVKEGLAVYWAGKGPRPGG